MADVNMALSQELMQVHFLLPGRAGRSPTFQDPGTPLFGLAGTRGFASPLEQLPSPRISINRAVASPKGVLLAGLGPASLTWTREYSGTRVPHSSSTTRYQEVITQ